MKPKCEICEKEVKIKDNKVYMLCMCDDENRILDINKIKITDNGIIYIVV